MSAVRNSWASASALFAMLLVLACAATAATAPDAAGLYLDEETIPGKPHSLFGEDELDAAHPNIVHRIYLHAGQFVEFVLGGGGGVDGDLYLYPPSANDFTAASVADSVTGGSIDEYMTYFVPSSGWYYVRVRRASGDGWCTLGVNPQWPAPTGPATPQRVWGADRYETACAIAEMNFPSWRNVDHVIIASGEDRAAADPLSASGLTWAYGAPILLVQQDRTPACVIEALQEIRDHNGPFYLHIVGGPVSVSPEAIADIEANVTNVIYDRLAPYDDRYTLAATIARRMVEERPEDEWLSIYTDAGALIANGEDPTTFFDALALSPIAASSGDPILLVGRDHIPAPTAQVLDDLNLRWRKLGGGPATVSEAVFDQLDAGDPQCIRLDGADRYETAATIARWGCTQVRLQPSSTGVAARLPDALSGGSFLGLRRGPLLLTQDTRLPVASRAFLATNTEETNKAFILGGPVSVEQQAVDAVDAALDP